MGGFHFETIAKSKNQYVVRISRSSGNSNQPLTFAFRLALVPKAEVNGISVKASMGPTFKFPFAVDGETSQWEVQTDTGWTNRLKRVKVFADGVLVHDELVS